MLRVAFPTTVRAEEAYCDIQYGFVRRTTARNTSWDFARFEVAAHRYVDISDACGGAALLNDSKYGYRLDAGTLDLNLLRSPTYPDSEADQGTHFFTYSFLPHAGGLCGSEVMQEAACLNRAPAVLPGKGTFALPCRVAGGEGVSLEVVKKAEKSDALVIRVVETDGAALDGCARLRAGNETGRDESARMDRGGRAPDRRRLGRADAAPV